MPYCLKTAFHILSARDVTGSSVVAFAMSVAALRCCAARAWSSASESSGSSWFDTSSSLLFLLVVVVALLTAAPLRGRESAATRGLSRD